MPKVLEYEYIKDDRLYLVWPDESHPEDCPMIVHYDDLENYLLSQGVLGWQDGGCYADQYVGDVVELKRYYLALADLDDLYEHLASYLIHKGYKF